MSSLAEAGPSGEERGKSGPRTWYELRITEESSLSLKCGLIITEEIGLL